MHSAYIIEIDEEAVGIAARDRGGFRFHAAVHAFNRLDGQIFPSVREATRAARAVTVATVRHADSLPPRRPPMTLQQAEADRRAGAAQLSEPTIERYAGENSR
jgi:hypothetical protein